MRTAPPLLLAGAALWLVGGCEDAGPAASIDAVVLAGSGGLPVVPDRLDLIVTALEASGEREVLSRSSRPRYEAGVLVPWTTRVAPRSPADVGTVLYRFRAVAVLGGRQYVAVQHRVVFLAGARLTLPLRLEPACVEHACEGPSTTCSGGSCRDDYVDACVLEGAAPACALDGGADAGQTLDGAAGGDATLARDAGEVDPGDACAGTCADPVVQVAAGNHHACARRASGALDCWGSNANGQVDPSAGGASPVPPHRLPAPEAALDVATGTWATCAAFESGRVACWGDAYWSAAGEVAWDGVRFVPGVEDVLDVEIDRAGSANQSCAVRRDGSVVCWSTERPAATVPGLSDVTSVHLGYPGLWCAVLLGGQLQCFRTDGPTGGRTAVARVDIGQGGSCIQATASSAVSCSLVHVGMLELPDAVAFSVGASHVCAVRTAGDVTCVGENLLGELGGPATGAGARWTAVVEGLRDVVALDAGQFYSCAVVASGGVWCWGTNGDGQLGDPAAGDESMAPVAVVGL